MKNPHVYYFSKPAVQNLDFKDFLKRYAPERFSDGPELKGMLGCLCLGIQGYGGASALLASPHVRRFYTTLARVWPHSLFFWDLDQTDALRVAYFCRVRNLSVVKAAGNPNCQVRCDQRELFRLIRGDFHHLKLLAARAGILPMDVCERTIGIFRAFDLLFPNQLPPADNDNG